MATLKILTLLLLNIWHQSVLGQDTLLDPTGLQQLCEGQSLTFTCTPDGGGSAWTIIGLDDVVTQAQATAFNLNSMMKRFFSPDDGAFTNPSVLTILNLVPEDTGATVQCSGAVDGNVTVSQLATFAVGPPNCTNITIMDISVNYLRVSWDNKSCNVPPSEYEVTWTTAGETFTEIGITATEYTITNLTGCSNYSVTIIPRDRCGAGEGVTMNITTLEGMPGKPVVTIDEICPVLGPVSITVEVPDDDLCEDTSVNVTTNVNGMEEFFTYSSPNQSYNLNFIPNNGETVSITVQGITSAGRGPMSNEITSEGITHLSVTDTSSGTLSLDTNCKDLSSKDIECFIAVNSESPMNITCPSLGQPFTLDKINPCTPYQVSTFLKYTNGTLVPGSNVIDQIECNVTAAPPPGCDWWCILIIVLFVVFLIVIVIAILLVVFIYMKNKAAKRTRRTESNRGKSNTYKDVDIKEDRPKFELELTQQDSKDDKSDSKPPV